MNRKWIFDHAWFYYKICKKHKQPMTFAQALKRAYIYEKISR